MVKVRSAPAAIDTLVNVTWPARAFSTTGPEAAPDAVVAFNEIPLPAAEATKLPAVEVTSPVVAVTPVPPVTVVVALNEVVAVTDPGAVTAAGRLMAT